MKCLVIRGHLSFAVSHAVGFSSRLITLAVRCRDYISGFPRLRFFARDVLFDLALELFFGQLLSSVQPGCTIELRSIPLETAALMLGTDKSRGYCLEMICADFLAGASFEGENPAALLMSLDRLYGLLPHPQRQEFRERTRVAS